MVTENGWSEQDEAIGLDGQVYDVQRKEYYRLHLEACQRAIQSGVDLRGYFAWSLMDNFEWISGYRMRLGLVHTDYVTQKRTVKLSGHYYRDCIAARQVL